MEISELLVRDRERIVSEALQAVQRARLLHYTAAGDEVSRARLEALFDVAVAAVTRRTLMPIEAHAEQIARERHHTGFGLGEVQTAFNVLEEAIWRDVESSIAPQELARHLGLISTVLGAGKDRLARAYVELATRTQQPALDLQVLFRGTPGA